MSPGNIRKISGEEEGMSKDKVKVRAHIAKWGLPFTAQGDYVSAKTEFSFPDGTVWGKDDVGIWVEVDVDQESLIESEIS